MKKKAVTQLVFIAITSVALIMVMAQFLLPNPLPVDAPADQFSAQRAIDRLKPLVGEPHPAGSPALVAVREDLVIQLEELGLEVEIQSTTGALPRYQVAGQVDNIIARLPGTNSSGALLLMAHYDSVPQGPGAGDNGAGVVTILECLRALQAERPFKNDLIVLFTDAEEYGTLGAQAFVQQSPWMEDIAVVLNIEGTLKGSVVLVETGPENGWFVRNFREASPHPLGYSWLFDLFGVMPNITDFMPFREAGLAGANLFSFNGGPNYHTPNDTIANMNPGSLQQHGEQTLALIDHFSEVDLSETLAANVIYFNLFMNLMIIYPGSWSVPLAVFSGIIVLLVIGWASKKDHLSLKGMFGRVPGVLACLAAGPTLSILLWSVTVKIFPQNGLYFPAHTYNDGWYAVAFSALAASLTLGLAKFLHRKHRWPEFLAAALLLLAFINLPVSIYLPGFSYLFTWPILFATAAWLLFQVGEANRPWLEMAGWVLLVAPSILLWLPVGLILYWSSGISFLPAVVFTATLPFTLVSSRMDFLAAKKGWLAPAIGGLIFLFCYVGAGLAGSFDQDHPMPLRIQYFYDGSSTDAYWINPVGPLSHWQEQFTKDGAEKVPWDEIFPSFRSTILKSPAPIYDLEPCVVTVVEDRVEGSLRTIRLLVAPTRQSDQLILSLPPETILERLEADGVTWSERITTLADWTPFYYVAPAMDGIEIILVTVSPGPSELMLTERSVGFDSIPNQSIQPRPEDIMSLGDYIYVNQTIDLH